MLLRCHPSTQLVCYYTSSSVHEDFSFFCHLSGFQISLQIPLEHPAGHLRAADILNFGGIMFSLCAGWAPVCVSFGYNCSH